MKLTPDTIDAFTVRVTGELATPERLTALLEALQVTAKHSPRAGTFNGTCPACRKATLHVRYKGTESSTFPVFWTCRDAACSKDRRRHSSLLGLVRVTLRCDLAGAMKWLASHLGHESPDAVLALPEPEPPRPLVMVPTIPKVALVASWGYPALLARPGQLHEIDPFLILNSERRVVVDEDVYAEVAAWAAGQGDLQGSDPEDLFSKQAFPASEVSFEVLDRHADYRVGADGTVLRRNPRTGVWSVLPPDHAKDGHRFVTVTTKSRVHRYDLAKLVLETFVGDAPEAGMVPVHRDGRPGNVRVENLQWGRRPKGTNKGARNGRSKLNEEIVADMRRRHGEGVAQARLVEEYGVSKGQVSKILNHQTWKHVGTAPAA